MLILDDYHVITEQQVHTTLSYLVEHLPPHLHIVLATRTDPPLSLSLLQTRGHLLEIRTEQLRCSFQETKAFFLHIVGTSLPDQTIQEVTARTEGWLVGLHLLALSLPEAGRSSDATSGGQWGASLHPGLFDRGGSVPATFRGATLSPMHLYPRTAQCLPL